jgi:hypothetical protein
MKRMGTASAFSIDMVVNVSETDSFVLFERKLLEEKRPP